MQSRTYGRDTEKEPTTNLFVGNFPFEYREEDLRDLFRAHGELKSVTVGMDRQTGRPKGHGFVEFNELDDAIAAFKALQGADVGGRTLRLDYDQGLARKAVTPRDRPRDDGARYDPYRRSPDRSFGRRDRSPRRDYGRDERRYPPQSPPREDRGRRPYSPPRRRSPVREDPRYAPAPRRSSRSPPREYRDPREAPIRASRSPVYDAGGDRYPAVHPSRAARAPPSMGSYRQEDSHYPPQDRFPRQERSPPRSTPPRVDKATNAHPREGY